MFVAYHFGDRDKWIETMVFPILRAFNIEVVTGEDMAGEIISEGVRVRIKNCDALIGFLTRREELGNGKWNTHPWVSNEIAKAWGDKKIIVVQEKGVDFSGSTQDRQFLVYDESKRDEFLVSLVKAVGRWSGSTVVQTRLLPSEFSQSVLPIVQARPDYVTCEYMFLINGDATDWQKGKIRKQAAGLIVYINTKDLPYPRNNVLISIRVQADGKIWESEFEQLDLLSVNMQLQLK